jgi:erythromycin esterase-like protein
VRALFEVLATEEAKWPRAIDEESKNTLRRVLPQLQGLIDHLSVNKDRFARLSSSAEFDRALRYALVMKQFAVCYIIEPPSRPAAQIANLAYLIDHAQPDARFVIWAHNEHIRVGNEGHLGLHLRDTYGRGYVALGFEFGQGSFLSRAELSPTVLGDFKVITLPAAPTGSLPWYLSQAHSGNFVLDLRAPAGSPVIEQWLHTSQIVHFGPWVYTDGLQFNRELSIAKEYDGIVFVEHTTPARPTANALRMAAAGEGL